MSHVYHEELPGFHEGQLLIDGCPECEARGADIRLALDHLDAERFERAWQRASTFNNGETEHELVGQISHAERPLLDVLWAIIVQYERRGVPITSAPPGALA